MSLEILETQIESFLKSPDSEALAIRGAWGSGKTYAWNRCLKEAKSKSNGIALKKYAYVSLFGVESLEQLKLSLFQKTIDKDLIGTSPSLATFKTNIMSSAKTLGKKSIPFISKLISPITRIISPTHHLSIDQKTSHMIALSVSQFFVKEAIICLDDLERTHLDAQDLMGFITELKEEKACKIVLILNDEQLGTKEKNEYEKYREKVIDKELLFSPTPKECCEIAFGKDYKFYAFLEDKCCKLGIKNIRILKKIKNLAEEIEKFLNERSDETQRNVLSSLVLFTYFFYTKEHDVPNLKFIKACTREFLGQFYMMKEEKEQEKKEEKEEKEKKFFDQYPRLLEFKDNIDKWIKKFADYEYSYTDELDLEIALSVERGFFMDDKMKDAIEKYDSEAAIREKEKCYDNVRRIYEESFCSSAEEFVNQLYEAAKGFAAYIPISDLQATLEMLHDLRAKGEADKLVEEVIKANNSADYFCESGHAKPIRQERFEKLDSKTRERFKEVCKERKEMKAKEPLFDILERIATQKGNIEEDRNEAASRDEGEYYSVFFEQKFPLRHIYNVRKFKIPGVHEKIEAALKKIAKINPLHRVRVEKKLGIKISDEDDPPKIDSPDQK